MYFRGPYVKDWESYELLANVNLYFDCNYGIIVFPSVLLDTVRQRESPSLPTKELSAYLQLPSSESFADSLKVLMRSLINQKVFKIEQTAEILNLSPRTLQRHLMKENTSYTQIRNQINYEMAVQKLAHSNDSIKEIADQLGYSSGGHFTRAFKRWSGKTPNQFRSKAVLNQD